jgi:hypothetical protein
MADPLWRISWLYKIKDERGKVIAFEPSTEQVVVICVVHLRKWRRVLIPKARQLWMSTALSVICLDQCLFQEGFAAACIDKTAEDAAKKLRDKVLLAWEQLPAPLVSQYELPSGYAPKGIGWKIHGSEEAPSSFSAGASFRGGQLQFLWISEWGAIQMEEAKRSEEILTGSLPAAEQGTTVIETTWRGGKGGDLWPIAEEAMQPEEQKGPTSWRLLFFPWWIAPKYSQTWGAIDELSAAYFAKLEAEEGIKLSQEQKLWYAGQRRTNPRKVKEEYPSTLAECWEAPVAGAIWGDQVAKAHAEGRVANFPVDGRVPVHCSWDLGSSLNTVVWYFQRMPNGFTRFIDVDYKLEMTLPQRAAWMKAKGYNYGTHYLPHDANQERHGTTFFKDWQAIAREHGIGGARVVPVTLEKWHGIDYTTQLFPSFEFRLPACEKGLEGLAAYRRQPQKANGVIVDEPVHDWASHTADGLRTMAEADKAGLVQGFRNSPMQVQNNIVLTNCV